MIESFTGANSASEQSNLPDGFDVAAWRQLMQDMECRDPNAVPSSVLLPSAKYRLREGGYDPETKRITVNSQGSRSKVAAYLAHEAQHFVDDINGELTASRQRTSEISAGIGKAALYLSVPIIAGSTVAMSMSASEVIQYSGVAVLTTWLATSAVSIGAYFSCWAERRAFSAQRRHRSQAEKVLANVSLSGNDN